MDSPSAPWLACRFGSDEFQYRLEPRYVCPQVRLDKPWEELLRNSARANYFSRTCAGCGSCLGSITAWLPIPIRRWRLLKVSGVTRIVLGQSRRLQPPDANCSRIFIATL